MTDDPARTLADLPKKIIQRLLEDEVEPVFQLLPPLGDPDRAVLKESVAKRGIRVPVELDGEGHVLDGHHRLQVAVQLGLDPTEIPVVVREDLDGEEDALEYVLEVNLGRRHLTPEERAQVARKLRDRGWSLRRIADRVGVSHETIRRDLSRSGVTNVTGEEGTDPPEMVEGTDGKTYPVTSSRPASISDGSKSIGPRTSPDHTQGRDGKGPDSNSRNRSSEQPRTREDRSASSEAGDEPEIEGDPRRKHLNAADLHLGKAMKLTSEDEPGIREELEELADRCNALERRIGGTGSTWVVTS